MTPDCESVREEIVAHLRGELDSEKSANVEAHANGCPACRAEIERISEFFVSIREATSMEPTPGFREGVLQVIRAERVHAPSSRRVARPSRLMTAFLRERIRNAPILMAAIAVHAAALLILAGIYLPVRIIHPGDAQIEPGLSGKVLEPEQLVEAAETALPEEFGGLRDPFERDPALPSFPWPPEKDLEVEKDPGPRPRPGHYPDPRDFGEKLVNGPTRAEVLAWFGTRFDAEKKAHAVRAMGAEGTGPMIARGLEWLARIQGENGGFDPVPFGGKSHFETGITGLALLAFLGDGNSLTRGQYRSNVERGIAYLMEIQDPETGRFGPSSGNYMYNHGIALQAVCEAAGMTAADRASRGRRLSVLLQAARRGVAYLLATQDDRGGWGYTTRDSESDTSVTAWPVANFKTALELGIVTAARTPEVEKALRRAAGWFRSVTLHSGAVGYRKKGSYKTGPHSLTAVSLYCSGLFDQDVLPPGDEILGRQMKLVTSKKATSGQTPDYYFWYYATFGLVHSGADSCRDFFSEVVGVLDGLQEKDGG
ncbi:MAG: anti-sigma factor family protein, partial [Planctomycetota bacterium]